MRFKEYNIKNIKGAGNYKYSSNVNLLDDFKQSGLKCAVVTEFTTKKPRYCATSIQATIKRFHEEYGKILCIYRNGSVFLINEAVEE